MVLPAWVTAALFALVAALPASHDPVRETTSAKVSGSLCPAYATLGTNGEPAVPLAPLRADRLVPTTPPTELLVCRYRGTTVLQLTGSRQVSIGLASAGTQLAASRRSMGGPVTCAATAGTRTPYLLGLRYPSGVLWVTAAYDVNGCEVTSTGSFSSDTYVGRNADYAFATGVWNGGLGQLASVVDEWVAR